MSSYLQEYPDTWYDSLEELIFVFDNEQEINKEDIIDCIDKYDDSKIIFEHLINNGFIKLEKGNYHLDKNKALEEISFKNRYKNHIEIARELVDYYYQLTNGGYGNESYNILAKLIETLSKNSLTNRSVIANPNKEQKEILDKMVKLPLLSEKILKSILLQNSLDDILIKDSSGFMEIYRHKNFI